MCEGAQDEAKSDNPGVDNLGFPCGRNMQGGFVQFDVANVEDAIALAERFKAAKKYRYFRGQRDARRPVTSSVAREDAAGQRKAREKFVAFADWVRQAEALVPYLADDDKIIAAAQHHQITPTTFIDFSTDPVVAGWFATDGGVPGQEGAIYLVDPDEVARIFEAVTRTGPVVRFLQLDVPNLWRLQAQSGLFLEAQCDISWIWPLDRIVFAQTGAPPAIERRLIYPDRRSHLEQMIENYSLQRAREAAIRDLIDSTGSAYFEVEHPLGDRMPALASTQLDQPWSSGPDERWVAIDVQSTPTSWSPDRIKANSSELADLIAARRNSTDLLMVDPDFPRRNGTAQAAVDILWEGLRPHPYSAKQIVTSLSSLMRLLDVFGDYPLDDGKSHRPAAEHLMTDPIEIEMGIAGGAATRAFVGSLELWGALSRETRTSLGLVQPVGGTALMDILGRFYGATLNLFDPRALVDLFASSIVPWQVATQRSPLCFSPVHLKSLGRP
jgi:hypothetical protein